MVYFYDGSFGGFLTVVFEAFRCKQEPEAIISLRSNRQMPLGESITINNDEKKAGRVLAGLETITSPKNTRLVNIAFLAEEQQTEMLLWRYMKKIFTAKSPGYYQNMLDEDIFELVQMARRVKHEVHRFHGFVRFEKTIDGIYFAPIDPDHNIVHLLTGHFKARYAGQPWVIYDTKRNYGIYYDTEKVMEVVIDDPGFNINTGKLKENTKDFDQDHYRIMWKAYYDAINIIERKNLRMMTRAMPKRYWKYLPEKEKH
jgi:probable DNA metabolism protein